MKYLVNVSYTNPAHEHVSLRRRVDTINRVVEARSEEEALNRVANQQRALGFLVRDAKVIEEAVSFGRSGGVMNYDPKTEKSEKPAKGVIALDKDGNLVGHYPDLETAKKLKPGHTYQTSKGVAKEEVELDEAQKKLKPSYWRAEWRMGTKSDVDKNNKKIYDKLIKTDPEKAAKFHDSLMKMRKEEVEQTDEALLPKQQAVADKLKASELAANKEKAGNKFGKSLRAAKVAAKMKKEEVEQIDELKKSTLASYTGKAAQDAATHSAMASFHDTSARARGKNRPDSKLHMTLADIRGAKSKKRLAGIEKATAKLAKEEFEYIEEKLTAADPASEWIKDFVASDNPKFEGKSKKERIQMALGAYYSAKRSKNEATEKKYDEKEVKQAERKQDKKQGSLNKIEMEPEIEMNAKGATK
jgi:colicin import membrane protein